MMWLVQILVYDSLITLRYSVHFFAWGGGTGLGSWVSIPPKCDKWNMVICQIMVEPFSLVQKISHKWKHSFSWIFTHPVMTWFSGPLVRNQELCSKKFSCSNKIWKMTMLQKNLRSDHAPENLRSDHAPSKIWEATMLHQKMNMTVSLWNVTNGTWSFVKLWWNPFLWF